MTSPNDELIEIRDFRPGLSLRASELNLNPGETTIARDIENLDDGSVQVRAPIRTLHHDPANIDLYAGGMWIHSTQRQRAPNDTTTPATPNIVIIQAHRSTSTISGTTTITHTEPFLRDTITTPLATTITRASNQPPETPTLTHNNPNGIKEPLTLTWTYNDPNNHTQQSIRLRRIVAGTYTYWNGTNFQTRPTITPYTFQSLNLGTEWAAPGDPEYAYDIAVIDQIGARSPYSEQVNITPAVTPIVPILTYRSATLEINGSTLTGIYSTTPTEVTATVTNSDPSIAIVTLTETTIPLAGITPEGGFQVIPLTAGTTTATFTFTKQGYRTATATITFTVEPEYTIEFHNFVELNTIPLLGFVYDSETFSLTPSNSAPRILSSNPRVATATIAESDQIGEWAYTIIGHAEGTSEISIEVELLGALPTTKTYTVEVSQKAAPTITHIDERSYTTEGAGPVTRTKTDTVKYGSKLHYTLRSEGATQYTITTTYEEGAFTDRQPVTAHGPYTNRDAATQYYIYDTSVRAARLGTHNITITATNAAHRPATLTIPITTTIGDAPRFENITHPEERTLEENETYTGTFTVTNGAGAAITATSSNPAIMTVTATATTSTHWTYTLTAIADGTANIEFRATRANHTTGHHTIAISVTDPPVPPPPEPVELSYSGDPPWVNTLVFDNEVELSTNDPVTITVDVEPITATLTATSDVRNVVTPTVTRQAEEGRYTLLLTPLSSTRTCIITLTAVDPAGTHPTHISTFTARTTRALTAAGFKMFATATADGAQIYNAIPLNTANTTIYLQSKNTDQLGAVVLTPPMKIRVLSQRATGTENGILLGSTWAATPTNTNTQGRLQLIRRGTNTGSSIQEVETTQLGYRRSYSYIPVQASNQNPTDTEITVNGETYANQNLGAEPTLTIGWSATTGSEGTGENARLDGQAAYIMKIIRLYGVWRERHRTGSSIGHSLFNEYERTLWYRGKGEEGEIFHKILLRGNRSQDALASWHSYGYANLPRRDYTRLPEMSPYEAHSVKLALRTINRTGPIFYDRGDVIDETTGRLYGEAVYYGTLAPTLKGYRIQIRRFDAGRKHNTSTIMIRA